METVFGKRKRYEREWNKKNGRRCRASYLESLFIKKSVNCIISYPRWQYGR
jgi:hypothetical protein